MTRAGPDGHWSYRGVALAAALLAVAGPRTARCAAAAPAPPAAPASAAVDPAAKLLLKAAGLLNRGLYQPAGEDYQTFLQQYPRHPEAANARYALAVCLYRQKQFDPAVESLTRVLADDKFEPREDALAVLGHAQLGAGRYDKAVAAFDQLLARFPQGKQAEGAALARAQALYAGKDYPGAAAAAQAFAQQRPGSEQRPAALYLLASAQRAQDQNEPAAATLQELLAKYPKHALEPDAMLLLGQSMEAQGKPDAAADQYRRMLAVAPPARAAEGRYSLGVALYKLGRYDDAAKELAAVVAAAPDNPYVKPARLQLGLAQLAAGNFGAARATLAESAKDDPARAADAKYGLAQADMAEKKYDAARAMLEDVMRSQPPPTDVRQPTLDHAVCLTELGKFAEAYNELGTLFDPELRNPSRAELFYRMAYCLHRLGRYAQSHELLGEWQRARGGHDGIGASRFDGPAAELDAENLFLSADYPAAAKAYAALAGEAKDTIKRNRYTFRLGQCAYFAGDYAKAAELFRPLVDDPKSARDDAIARAAFLLGDALLQQGKNAEAVAALQAYLPTAKADQQETQFKLALAQLRANQPDAAKANFDAAAGGPAESQWTGRALLELGQLAYKHDPPLETDEAAAALKRALAGHPPDDVAAGALYLLGWIDFGGKRYADAAGAWGQVATKYDKNANAADAQFQRGVALREAGKTDAALDAFQAYAKAHPDGPHAARAGQLAAAALSALHRDDEAKQVLASLAAKPAASDSVLYDLAWAQKATNDGAAAGETYRRLLKEQADSKLAPAARTELAELLYADKKYDEAVELLNSALADKGGGATPDPKVAATAQYLLGWCYQKLGNADRAAETFDAYVKRESSADPAATDADRLASALLQAGLARAAGGQFEAAAKPLQAMLSRFPKHKDAPVALLKLGEVQADAGAFDAALKTNRSFLDAYGTDPFAYRAHFGVGWALENLKRYADARQAYAQVIAANNGETAARAQFQTGETYLEEGKFEPAVPALLAVEDVYAYPKWSARALFEAGRAFEQLKQPNQAKKCYAQVVAKYPDAAEVELSKERLKAVP